MKKQTLLGLVIVGCLALLSSAVFGATLEITGKVLAITNTVMTVESGKDVWDITLGPNTKVTGESKVGSTVMVKCNDTDAQKKEIQATKPTGG